MAAKLVENGAVPVRMQKQQEMFSLIESWRGGEQTQQAFCKTHGLAYSAFHYWYKKYRKQQQADQPPAFVPIHLHSANSSPLAELVMPDGRRLNFYQAVEASFLRALLS